MTLPMAAAPAPARMPSLRWPLPALVAWAAGWGLLLALSSMTLPGWAMLALSWLPSWAVAASTAGPWRRVIVLAGLPLALVLSGSAVQVPVWAWLLVALCIVALYPLSAWRDAPLFPTPLGALAGIAPHLHLARRARILDAGSGLGHGLRALQQAFPDARIEGVERSGLLVWLARLRPGTPPSRRGDMWSTDWSAFDVVYLFQRPETMPRAWDKARCEMREGAWLVSLEFEIPGRRADALAPARAGGARSVLAYRIPGSVAPDRGDARGDRPAP